MRAAYDIPDSASTMNGIPHSFEFNGLLCYSHTTEQYSYYFVPLYADLERTANGRPMFNLLAIGTGGYLLFTAVWRASADVLESLRNELARRDAVGDPARITLTFPAVNVRGCQILLNDGDGQFRVIAFSSTSGVPPFAAVFSVNLTGEQFERVAAAVNGRAGLLSIEYDAAINAPIAGTGVLVPQSSDLIPWLREYRSGGEGGFRSAIEEAIDDGLAAIRVSVPYDPTGRLVSALYDRVLSRAAAVLPAWIDAADEGADTEFDISVSLVDSVRLPIRPGMDLSTLRGNSPSTSRDGERSPTGESRQMAETSRPLRVRLGFRKGDAPLAWIRVRGGVSEAVLRGPGFTPADMLVDPGEQSLTVSVSYTNGASTYRRNLDLPGSDELLLMPDMLGLTLVSINAEPLADAGVRSAQIWLRYAPPRRSDEQRHTIQFHMGAWAAQWWLTTLDERTLRSLDYTWSAVTATGQVVNNSVLHSGSSEITLSISETGGEHVAD